MMYLSTISGLKTCWVTWNQFDIKNIWW